MGIQIDMVGLVVKDLQASLSFYRTLGVEFPDPEPGSPYVEFQQDNGLRLSLNHIDMVKSIDPSFVEPIGQGIEVAFLCDSPSDVNRVHAEVIAAGFGSYMAPWDAFWGQRYAIVIDPDGYHVALFAPLPTEN